jgi:hypothetical protein
MAWTETFHCDVCNKQRKEDSEDWWLVWDDSVSSATSERQVPAIKIMRWDLLMSHSTEAQHLCGASCLHTILDRWLAQRD